MNLEISANISSFPFGKALTLSERNIQSNTHLCSLKHISVAFHQISANIPSFFVRKKFRPCRKGIFEGQHKSMFARTYQCCLISTKSLRRFRSFFTVCGGKSADRRQRESFEWQHKSMFALTYQCCLISTKSLRIFRLFSLGKSFDLVEKGYSG